MNEKLEESECFIIIDFNLQYKGTHTIILRVKDYQVKTYENQTSTARNALGLIPVSFLKKLLK
jgi:hypothetical protein